MLIGKHLKQVKCLLNKKRFGLMSLQHVFFSSQSTMLRPAMQFPYGLWWGGLRGFLKAFKIQNNLILEKNSKKKTQENHHFPCNLG